jgi:hypothetical protein
MPDTLGLFETFPRPEAISMWLMWSILKLTFRWAFGFIARLHAIFEKGRCSMCVFVMFLEKRESHSMVGVMFWLWEEKRAEKKEGKRREGGVYIGR